MSNTVPVYFETSWSILSSIGLSNLLFGLMVLAITGFSRILLVPLIVSAATAVANGMCYYAYYADNPQLNRAIASAFADFTWVIQEGGLSFYSYVILTRILRGSARTVFLLLFWTFIGIVFGVRMTILVVRLRSILQPQLDLQGIIDDMHIGYFLSIALLEMLSAFFLLRKFNEAKSPGVDGAVSGGLFQYLMRSTEVRLALLAVVGVTRSITISFQKAAQAATSTASQADRFAYTLECVFPIIMYIDVLSSRIVFTNLSTSGGTRSHERSHFSASGKRKGAATTAQWEYEMGNMPPRTQTSIRATKVTSDVASDQECIMEGANPPGSVSIQSEAEHSLGNYGVTKTVEFEVSTNSKV